MKRCVVCDGTFCSASMIGPAEDCECGSNCSRRDLREMSADDRDEMLHRARQWAGAHRPGVVASLRTRAEAL